MLPTLETLGEKRGGLINQESNTKTGMKEQNLKKKRGVDKGASVQKKKKFWSHLPTIRSINYFSSDEYKCKSLF